MGGQTYTHRDLAGLLQVSETTVKSYRSKFPTFLPVARQGKPVRLHAEALEVCRRIRDLFAEGLSIVQTSDRLRAEFKEYPLNRRLSTSSGVAAAGALPPGGGPEAEGAVQLEARLDARLEALAQAQQSSQDEARLAAARLERLEAEVRNLATLEAASKSLVAELLSELRAARAAVPPTPPPQEPPRQREQARPDPQAGPQAEPQADATVLTARKIVTVHGQAGPVASYALGREPRPEPSFAPPARPSQGFLDLPVVIQSDRGEFLGLPGGQSVARLVELLLPEGGAAAWFAEAADGGEAWICEASQGPALTRELLFERTTTPRGNLVGLLRRLRTLSGTAATEASAQEVQGFFRQILDQLGS